MREPAFARQFVPLGADCMLHCTQPSLDITSTISLEQMRCDAEFRSPRLVEEHAECYAVRHIRDSRLPCRASCQNSAWSASLDRRWPLLLPARPPTTRTVSARSS